MNGLNLESGDVRHFSGFTFGRLGQQILNLLDVGAGAAEMRSLRALDRRELEDCGMTPADVAPALSDIYANDFRVTHLAELRAAA